MLFVIIAFHPNNSLYARSPDLFSLEIEGGWRARLSLTSHTPQSEQNGLLTFDHYTKLTYRILQQTANSTYRLGQSCQRAKLRAPDTECSHCNPYLMLVSCPAPFLHLRETIWSKGRTSLSRRIVYKLLIRLQQSSHMT